MRHLTIRNVSPELADALRREKERRGTSVNQLVLDLLGAALGVRPAPWSNGLEEFVGGWSDEDLREFEDAIAPLERVDEDLWR